MSTIDDLSSALVNAHKAGDTAAAKVLANEIVRIQSHPIVAKPSSSAWDTVVDTGKSLGSGILNGVAQVAGAPGSLDNMATQGLTWLENKAIGAVTGKDGTFQAHQNPLNISNAEAVMSDATNGANEYAPKTTPGKYSKAIGEAVPSAAIGGLGVGNLVRNAVAPAIGSEAAGQLTEGTAAEPYARFAGALVGGAVPGLAERVITPFPMGAERKAAADVLSGEGIDMTAGQKSGNNALRYAESELGGSTAQGMMEKQGEQFTSAVLKRAGIDAPRATPEVLDEGLKKIGKQFDDLAANNTMVPDQGLYTDIRGAVTDYRNLVPESQRAPVVNDIVSDIAQGAKGGMSGESYQALRSRLDKLQRASSDPQLSKALSGIRNALDDTMERSIATANPQDLGKWQEARQQYRNYLVIEKAATGAGENAALGLISPSQLRNAVVQQGRRYYARGQGDFADLARSGEALLKPLPNSGTAGRSAARNLGGASLPAMLGAGGGAMVGGPIGAGVGAATGALVPRAVGEAILSKPGRAYLSNQLIEPTRLTDPRAGLLFVHALSRLADDTTQQKGSRSR